MEKKQNNHKIAAFAAGTLLVGGLVAPNNANANLFEFEALGSGSEIRAEILNMSIEFSNVTNMNIEAKCGEKTKEAKCGEKTKEAKCGEKSKEAKCGEKTKEAKCGEKTKEAKCGEKTKEAKCGEKTKEAKCGKK